MQLAGQGRYLLGRSPGGSGQTCTSRLSCRARVRSCCSQSVSEASAAGSGRGTTVRATCGSSMVSAAANRSLLAGVPSWTSSTWLTPTPGGAQLGDRAGLALADLGDAVAAGQVEVHVAVAAEDADRQRRRLAAVEVDPVEGDLLDLLVGRVDVRGAQDQFLGLAGPWPVCTTANSGLLVRTISGWTCLPAFSARSTTAVISSRS